jgi:3-oxoacyl-[acyl-carrier protein] reductase
MQRLKPQARTFAKLRLELLMDLELAGKVALITGSTKGIGLASAISLAEEGCVVLLNARTEADVLSMAEHLRARGLSASALVADVCNSDEARNLVARAVETAGRLDILVNNVGAIVGGMRVLESTDDDWKAAMEINFFQVVRMMRLAAPHMKTSGGGTIVNIASISGWVPQLVRNGQYGASKAALVYCTERWALEFVPLGIRVNAISPGSIICDGNGWDRYRDRDPRGFDEYVRRGFPLGRLGTPEEIGHVVAFLSSPKSHWINGRHIAVDGLEQPFDRPGRTPF